MHAEFWWGNLLGNVQLEAEETENCIKLDLLDVGCEDRLRIVFSGELRY
jgi:hypothetical protein